MPGHGQTLSAQMCPNIIALARLYCGPFLMINGRTQMFCHIINVPTI